MNRRSFIATAIALALLPSLGLAAGPIQFKPGLVQRRLRRGETVLIRFYTSWCTTCARQERVINALRGENAAYDQQITYIEVDWDLHSRSDLARRLNIPRRSTLVVLKGDEELGRIVAGTAVGDIKALMDKALAAATA
jgi:hypothetical protein